MRISRRQLEGVLQVNEPRWLHFVCASLESSYPMSPLFTLDDHARLIKAADLCDRARANDLRTDAELLGFVFLMHEMAPDFDQHPYVRALLDRAGEPIAKRWERLFDRRDEALERAFLDIERGGARPGRSFFIERCGAIEEAFPSSHSDPRFIACFRAIKARNEPAQDRWAEGG